jgi:hypothetical protein
MTITNTAVKQIHEGDGSTVAFAIPFAYFAQGDVRVVLRDNSVSPATESLLVKDTHYTLTGGSGTVLPTTVTMVTAPVNNGSDVGEQLLVIRREALHQDYNLVNSGSFASDTTEQAFDKLLTKIQQVEEKVSRSLLSRETSSLSDLELPQPVADNFIKWNDTATALETSEASATNIKDVNITADADITRTKLAPGTADQVLINDGSGEMSSEAQLAKVRGGTGADNSSVTFPASGTIPTNASSSTLTNKTLTSPAINGGDINLGTASATSKIVASKDTFANLDAIAKEEASLYYGTDTKKLYVDDGTALNPVGSGGGSLEIYHQEDFEITAAADFSSGNNATPNIAGTGTLDGVLSDDTTLPLADDSSIKYVMGSSSTNDFFLSPAVSVDQLQTDKHSGYTQYYNYNGDNGDMKLIVLDESDNILSSSLDLIDASSSDSRFAVSFYVPSGVTAVHFGMQVVTGNSGKIFRMDNVELSVNPFVYKQLITSSHLATGAGNAGTALTGDTTNIDFTEVSDESSVFDGTTYTVPETGEYHIEGSLIFTAGANGNVQAYIGGVADKTLSTPSTTTSLCSFSGKLSLNAGDALTIRYTESKTIVNTSEKHWISIHKIAETTEHVVTPAKSNMTDWTDYTPTFGAGFGTCTNVLGKYRRVGDQMEVLVSATSGTVAASLASFTLPSGHTIDSGKLTFNNTTASGGDIAGILNSQAPFAGTIDVAVTAPATDATKIYFGANDATALGHLTPAVGTSLMSSSTIFSARVSVPIEEWSSDVTFLAAVPVEQVCYIKDVKSSGTDGGTFTSGAWQTRDLNTLEGDTGFISLASDQFILSPGKYDIYATAPGININDNVAKLRNITDSTDDIIGSVSNTSVGTGEGNIATVMGQITITSSKTFELQHQCETTRATDGYGRAAGFTVSAIYSQIKIRKLK